MKIGYVYILSNKTNKVLYTGVTSHLKKRAYDHRNKIIPGFTKRYNVDKLVYFEEAGSIESAIAREKQIKGWLKEKKMYLIESLNPEFRDLYPDL